MIDQVTTHQAEEDIRNETILIYVDGQIVPKAEAKVSVFDSGFMLGTVCGNDCDFIMGAGPLLTSILIGCLPQQKQLIYPLA